MQVFLDESGSSGDAIKTGKNFDFAGQQIFVLAAIATKSGADLAAAIAGLTARHGLLPGEIKSTALVNKPAVAADLAKFLQRADCPVFIEVMDKRYLIVINLINQIIMPPVPGFDDRPEAQAMRSILADALFGTLPSAVLVALADACETPTRDGVEAIFDQLRLWVDNDPHIGPIQPTIAALIADSAADFAADDAHGGHRRWLPIPDESVTGRPIWMLPAFTAFTNVYARINKYRGGALAGVSLIHDDHMLYGPILIDAKAQMERLSVEDGLPAVRNADYRLREHAGLVFADSAATPGIQAADILGGFVMRFVRDLLYGQRPTPDRFRTMGTILALSSPPEARGLNFVMSAHQMAQLGIGWS
ncbi:MAG: hypothetical protein JWR80_2894 [Bradyrhizobium sp.]|nr:hypothetical protein [Bradyrhizobium sp.]